eukprot:14899603-Alexandrium_andersonii.AAC.2
MGLALPGLACWSALESGEAVEESGGAWQRIVKSGCVWWNEAERGGAWQSVEVERWGSETVFEGKPTRTVKGVVEQKGPGGKRGGASRSAPERLRCGSERTGQRRSKAKRGLSGTGRAQDWLQAERV